MDSTQVKLIFNIFLFNMKKMLNRFGQSNVEIGQFEIDKSYDDIIAFASKIATNAENDNSEALHSIFNELNGNNGKVVLAEPNYQQISEKLGTALQNIVLSEEYINPLLFLLQECCSEVPYTYDTSVYDVTKITAMLSACILEKFNFDNVTDFKTEIEKPDFSDRKLFLLYSFDFSGIQDFIYSISGASAGKYLKARSFYLEILTEHIVDELLTCCGLSRCNLLYSAGCHAYLMFPNTPDVTQKLEKKQLEIKQWFFEQFDAKLFIGFAHTECSTNDLLNIPLEKNPFPEMYGRLSKNLSEQKLNRYTADEINILNSKRNSDNTRECIECKSSAHVNSDNYCPMCQCLKNISSDIIKKDVCFKIASQGDIPLPCDAFLSVCTYKDTLVEPKNNSARRFYTKNSSVIKDGKLNLTNNVLMGDYTYSKEFSGLLDDTKGIKRIGVLRADVDKLGQTFMTGFVKNGSYKNLTLSRTATLSRQLSYFFKQKINTIIDGKKVNIIYSGGDDVFIVGQWNDVIEASLMLQNEFGVFTQNSLQLSAGIGIYGVKFPVKRFAENSGELEHTSKTNGRNRVTLFDKEFCYTWDVFRKNVMEEKHQLIKNFFSGEDNERGTAFLYRILELIRGGDNKINLVRLAYMLTRLEPTKSERKETYNVFSKSILEWALNEDSRKELELAIIIYVYEERK
jgi:CRISPR-associated protein Csm1